MPQMPLASAVVIGRASSGSCSPRTAPRAASPVTGARCCCRTRIVAPGDRGAADAVRARLGDRPGAGCRCSTGPLFPGPGVGQQVGEEPAAGRSRRSPCPRCRRRRSSSRRRRPRCRLRGCADQDVAHVRVVVVVTDDRADGAAVDPDRRAVERRGTRPAPIALRRMRASSAPSIQTPGAPGAVSRDRVAASRPAGARIRTASPPEFAADERVVAAGTDPHRGRREPRRVRGVEEAARALRVRSRRGRSPTSAGPNSRPSTYGFSPRPARRAAGRSSGRSRRWSFPSGLIPKTPSTEP